MKKTVKRILCLALVVALCLCFTGCKELDNAREHHALLQEDGTVKLNGKTYVQLPYCEEFTPPMGESEMITITEPDVPVLLSDFFGIYYGEMSEDGRFIAAFEEADFCEESIAEEVISRIEEGFQPAGIQYTYYDLDENTDEWQEKFYHLTEEQMNAVKRVLASVTPLVTDDVDGEYTVSLEQYSEDGWFSNYLCDLYSYNGRYALVCWEEADVTIYEVPIEMNGIFEGILKAYTDSEETYYR